MASRATPLSAWWSSARKPTRARFSSSAKTPTRRRRIISTSRRFTPRRSAIGEDEETAGTRALAQPGLLLDSANVDQHRRDREDKVGELCRPHAVHHGFRRSPHVAAVHISAL